VPITSRRGSRSNKRETLVHSTYRIKEPIVKALEEESKKRRTTISVLVNNILENYLNSEMYFEQLGFILVSKDFLRKVFSKIEKAEDIEEFGRELGLTTAKEYVSYFFPQVNSKSLVQYLDLWFKRFQSYQHRIDNDRNNNNNNNPKRHYYTVIHDINMNFSIALKTILEGLIVPIIKSDIEFRNITASAISFSFEVLR
jgi:hypothetical protein